MTSAVVIMPVGNPPLTNSKNWENAPIVVVLVGHDICWGPTVTSETVECELVLTEYSSGHVDMYARLVSDATVAEITLDDIPVRGEVTIYADGSQSIKYDISDYDNGAFIDIAVPADGPTIVYLAADVGDTQYSVAGTVPFRPDIPCTEYHTQQLSTTDSRGHVSTAGIPSTEAAIMSARHENDKKIAPFLPSYVPDRPKVYSIVHEVFFDSQNDVPEQVGSWCVDYSWVDYALYREAVSEAQIKSDLQYYNKKHYTIDSKSKIVGAYEIDTHGHSNDEPDRAFMTYDNGWLYPSEVQALWGPYSSDYYVRPDETIVLASACQSLWNTGENGESEMGDAFVNFGARGYVGSTFDLPLEMDPWTGEFWWSLTYQDQSISSAIYDANIAIGWAGTSYTMQVHLSSYGSRGLPN
ncbi:MAG: hypothetical protein HXY34_01415 [Candidatus Thorarchaeota archaeon]|nr:hypothetical protein [Candidatus Thorarchaeota archaeon]